MLGRQLVQFALLASTALATPLDVTVAAVKDKSGTAMVNLKNMTGTPQNLASGALYGLPQNENQIPSHFFTDIGFNFARAGGSQLPAKGWIENVTSYETRFTSALHNYVTTRKEGGKFILLISDMWGADGGQSANASYPGDNGDFSDYDKYLDHVIHDMKAHEMIDEVYIEVWNEPDLVYQGVALFWNRDEAQYLQMWGRCVHRFRAEFGNQVLISGPASAYEPFINNTWWNDWAQFVVKNDSVPDQYVWHMEGGTGDLLSAYDGLVQNQLKYGLPDRPINIDEYATYTEMCPSGIAWWIGQLERINANGLRGNWLSGYALHDYLASLLGKPHANTPQYNPKQAGYWPNGEWQLYKYYHQNMTGMRVGTLPSPDLILDTYATVGDDGIVRVMAGVRVVSGTRYVQVNNLASLGLPKAANLKVHEYSFDSNVTDQHYGYVAGPTDLGYAQYAYSGNSVVFPIVNTARNTTAYVFEFAVDNRTTF